MIRPNGRNCCRGWPMGRRPAGASESLWTVCSLGGQASGFGRNQAPKTDRLNQVPSWEFRNRRKSFTPRQLARILWDFAYLCWANTLDGNRHRPHCTSLPDFFTDSRSVQSEISIHHAIAGSRNGWFCKPQIPANGLSIDPKLACDPSSGPASEAGALPSEGFLAEMGKFNEDLIKAGVLLAAEGLQASSKGARIKFAGEKRTVIDGPFAETKELVAGFWLWKCASLQDAIEWVKRCPNPMPGEEAEIEIRRVFESEDFGPAPQPELREEAAEKFTRETRSPVEKR